jgi:prolyl-tRNA editing enzyme YbaK/EbsC (Cys-tRNA(Pro) deacylase)
MPAVTAAHRNVDLVLTALRARGAAPRAMEGLRVLPDAVTTAAAAAAALGVEVGQIANSLVFDADGTPLLVLTSGAHRVDTGKVAALLGAARVRRASPEFVRAATGQPIGGVAPVGHPAPLRTLVDRALEAYPEIWAAGGIPHAVFPTTFAELVEVTDGEPAEVAG